MRNIIKNPKTLLVVSLILSVVLTITLITSYHHTRLAETKAILDSYSAKIESMFEITYLSIDIVEAAISIEDANLTNTQLDVLMEPLTQYQRVRAISILPDGIVEYMYPFEGNEDAIGDNVFEMADRKSEAEIALETRETILNGPYELTQGGIGLIGRKAIFLPDENGNEEFWGMVAIVWDAPDLLQTLNLPSIGDLNASYELSATVNGLEKNIIASSESFNADAATYVDIPLANGMWQMGVHVGLSSRALISIISTFLACVSVSFIIYRYRIRKELELHKLQKEVYVDPLTGVYNRKKLNDFINSTNSSTSSYAVYYMDLNYFKQVNDTYGHDVGDELLISFAKRAKRITRNKDLLMRIGGDEFAIILKNISGKEEALGFLNRLESSTSQPFIINKVTLPATVSIGYAIYPSDADSVTELLALADARMYEDKRKKKAHDKNKV